jgi:hypothetical protein
MKRKVLISTGIVVTLSLLIVGVAVAFAAGNVDGVWSTIDDGGGATCDGWATGLGDTPTSWSDTVPGIQTPPNTDENQVRYGDPSNADCPGGGNWQTELGQQSGFGFDGVDSVGTAIANTPFYLGRFTHYNNPIQANNQFGHVFLDVTVSGITCLDSTAASPASLTVQYRFDLDETSNQAPCAYSPIIPSDNYCPDKVTVSNQPASQSFVCPEGTYTIQILGFMPPAANGTCPGAAPGTVSNDFITQEQTDNNACLWASITAFDPNAVEIQSFTATGEADVIRLDWETASEVDNLGFNLYRAESFTGVRTKLNNELIPAVPGSNQGAVYDFTDTTPARGITYYYWLEDVSINYNTAIHGPETAKVLTDVVGSNPLRIFLPSVSNVNSVTR